MDFEVRDRSATPRVALGLVGTRIKSLIRWTGQASRLVVLCWGRLANVEASMKLGATCGISGLAARWLRP